MMPFSPYAIEIHCAQLSITAREGLAKVFNLKIFDEKHLKETTNSQHIICLNVLLVHLL